MRTPRPDSQIVAILKEGGELPNRCGSNAACGRIVSSALRSDAACSCGSPCARRVDLALLRQV